MSKHTSTYEKRPVGRAASGGALAPEPLRATRNQPEYDGFAPKNIFTAKFSG